MAVAPSEVARAVTANVGRFYEAFPYPKYPLLAKPLWTDGYLAASAFATSIAHRKPPADRPGAVLVAGAGEIVSFVIRKWESPSKTLHCVDLSARSLRRARFRLLADPRPTVFAQRDLDEYLDSQAEARFEHVDAYGMLHHMATPSSTLRRLAQALIPGGTMRVMVYNTPARSWLNETQRALALLGVDPHDGDKRRAARALLTTLRDISPAYAQRLAQVGEGTLASDVRFVDTFLHPHELRLSPTYWMSRIAEAGLEVAGLFDRYAELDDLANPLWQPPTADELEERSADGRYENNLELYLRKPGQPLVAGAASAASTRDLLRPRLLKHRRPPRLWFAFNETRALGPELRRAVWGSYVSYTVERKVLTIDRFLSASTLTAMQRLARVGAVLPGQIKHDVNREALLRPMAKEMTTPALPSPTKLAGTPVEATVRQWLEHAGRLDERRVHSVLLRLERAQR